MIYTLLVSLILAQANKPLTPAKHILNKSIDTVISPAIMRGTTKLEIDCKASEAPTTVVVPVVNFSRDDFHLVLKSTSIRIAPAYPARNKNGYLLTAKPWSVKVYVFRFKTPELTRTAQKKFESNQRVRVGIIDLETNEFRSKLVRCELYGRKRMAIGDWLVQFGHFASLAVLQLAADLTRQIDLVTQF